MIEIIPQCVAVAVLFLGLLDAYLHDGETREWEVDFRSQFYGTMAILVLLLYGGFFNVFYR